jgi:hypothetical protein
LRVARSVATARRRTRVRSDGRGHAHGPPVPRDDRAGKVAHHSPT